MRKLLKIVFIICGSWLSSYYLDWRFSFIIPFLFGIFLPLKKAFWEALISCIAVAIVWLTASLITDSGNNGVLSARIAELLGLSNGKSMVILAGILGGIIGLTGGLSGYYLQKSVTMNDIN